MADNGGNQARDDAALADVVAAAGRGIAAAINRAGSEVAGALRELAAAIREGAGK